jgi:chemotaxis-related protein WspD
MTSSNHQADRECWKHTGIQGDHSCGELERHVHCRSCPVYHLAGRRLLDRPVPEDYRAEWSRRLAEPPAAPDPDSLKLMVFRVARTWLALPSGCFDESLAPEPVRRVPHRSNRHFLGLVNTRGDLQLCFTLEHLFDPHEGDMPVRAGAGRAFPRLLVIRVRGQRWVFPADEVYGILHWPRSRLETPPANLGKAPGNLAVALFDLDGLRVSLMDPERLADRFLEALQ